MQKDLINIRATNARNFYRNNMISKRELEKRVQPYLILHKTTFTSFLAEDTIRRISMRKNKRRVEKLRIVGIIFLLVAGLYLEGSINSEVNRAEVLAYDYR